VALPVGRTAKFFVGVFVSLLTALVALPASAEETRAVEVVATGAPSATSAVEALVRELLNRLPVAIRWVDAPHIDPREVLAHRVEDPGVVARVWVDLSRPAGARLFVANTASDHFLVRVVPAGDGHVEVEQEAVAQIIGFAVEAILAGGEIGVTRDVAVSQILTEPNRPEAAPPDVVPRVDPFQRRGLSGEVGALVGLRALESGPAVGVVSGLVATMTGATGSVVQPLLVLELQYQAPVDLQANAVAVRLEGAGGILQGGLQARFGSRVSARAAIGLGADALYAQPHVPTGSLFSARGPFWIGPMIATARVGFEVVAVAPVSLFAVVGCDLDMSGVHFPVSDDGSAEPNVIPWRVWPVAQLGVSVSFPGSISRAP